ncbi:MAG: hypothetical protein ABI432_04120, partial [Flavobacteriales bacterium]
SAAKPFAFAVRSIAFAAGLHDLAAMSCEFAAKPIDFGAFPHDFTVMSCAIAAFSHAICAILIAFAAKACDPTANTYTYAAFPQCISGRRSRGASRLKVLGALPAFR